jgi:hypothetical protein
MVPRGACRLRAKLRITLDSLADIMVDLAEKFCSLKIVVQSKDEWRTPKLTSAERNIRKFLVDSRIQAPLIALLIASLRQLKYEYGSDRGGNRQKRLGEPSDEIDSVGHVILR